MRPSRCAAMPLLAALASGAAAPMPASGAAAPTGDQACAECHRQEAARYRNSPMAHALEPASESGILRQHADLTFQEGAYASRITWDGPRTLLSVTDGREAITAPLLWAFGRGQAGQTYVFERNGAFYESRVSFFNALGGLDLTMGAAGIKPSSLDDAAGRRMDAIGARDCFGCHATGAVSGGRLHLESMTPGVGCESCHGPAGKHVTAVRAGDIGASKMRKLGSLGAEDMSELCGRCHRTWSQIALNGPRGVHNVRFQPYRLANSKCFDAGDARIRCSACHDPHSPLETNVASYDAKCAACHSAAGQSATAGRSAAGGRSAVAGQNAGATAAGHTRTCSVARQNCVTCHMPKLELPGSHARFSDHQIRIARAGEPYPN